MSMTAVAQDAPTRNNKRKHDAAITTMSPRFNLAAASAVSAISSSSSSKAAAATLTSASSSANSFAAAFSSLRNSNFAAKPSGGRKKIAQSARIAGKGSALRAARKSAAKSAGTNAASGAATNAAARGGLPIQLPPMHPSLDRVSDEKQEEQEEQEREDVERGDAGGRGEGDAEEGGEENPAKRSRRQIARVSAPSPGTKRCCKKDLIRSLRVGEILEVTRVEQHYLDEYNNGEKIRARFTGKDFYDLSKNTTYRSLSQWVKKRLVDVGALGVKSNISGWDFCAVERDGRKEGVRMLVDEDDEAEGGQRSFSSSSGSPSEQQPQNQQPANADGDGEAPPTFFNARSDGQFSIAERMAKLCQQSESSSSASSSPGITEVDARSPEQLTTLCNSLRDELHRARAYADQIKQQLSVRENQLKSLSQKHEYGLRGRD